MRWKLLTPQSPASNPHGLTLQDWSQYLSAIQLLAQPEAQYTAKIKLKKFKINVHYFPIKCLGKWLGIWHHTLTVWCYRIGHSNDQESSYWHNQTHSTLQKLYLIFFLISLFPYKISYKLVKLVGWPASKPHGLTWHDWSQYLSAIQSLAQTEAQYTAKSDKKNILLIEKLIFIISLKKYLRKWLGILFDVTRLVSNPIVSTARGTVYYKNSIKN